MQKTHHAARRPFLTNGDSAKISARFNEANASVRSSPAIRETAGPRRDERHAPDASKWEIKDFLTFRINLLYRLLDRQLKRMLAEYHELSIAEWRVLGQLATDSPTTVRDIAARTYMAKSQISRAAASLVRTGRALRTKDRADERSAVFAITKEGRRKYEIVMRMNRERQRRLLAQLGPGERDVMFAAIGRLIDYVRASI